MKDQIVIRIHKEKKQKLKKALKAQGQTMTSYLMLVIDKRLKEEE